MLKPSLDRARDLRMRVMPYGKAPPTTRSLHASKAFMRCRAGDMDTWTTIRRVWDSDAAERPC
jgi:hypothetical protein